MMDKLVGDRVAIVTGGGRGIGEAISRALAAQGARVVISDLDEAPAMQAAARIREEGGEAVHVHGDVRRGEDCDRMCRFAVETFGKLDILVNNAGTTRDRTVHNMSDEWWDLVIDTCLRGPFNMIRAAAPYLREVAKAEVDRDGHAAYHRKVVNVSSTAALRGNPGQANYTAAKSGVIGLTRTVSREWGRFWINVNCVMPGFVDTRLTRPREEPSSPVGLPAQAADRILPLISLGRIGKPEDIASAVLFLASPMADWITGQVLTVDGGLT